jgi:hypothetical protein
VPVAPLGAAPADCLAPSALFPAAGVLATPDHDCFAWIDDLRGRVARSGSASATMWTQVTVSGNPLITSAIHTLGVGWFGPEGDAIPMTLRNPKDQFGVARIRLFDAESDGISTSATPLFDFFNPEIPSGEHADRLRNILPRHDFFVGVIDNQRLSTDPAEVPGPLQIGEVPIRDPAGATMTSPAFADPASNEIVLLLGFPSGEDLSASVGRVLSDDEARSVVAALAAAGDEEGAIFYDAEAEMILEADAAVGMSGGGVYDRQRRQLGIIVRVSEAVALPTYVRAVRMSFVVTQMQSAFDTLSIEMQSDVAMFLPPEVLP